MVYVCIGTKIPNIPKPNGMRPMTVTIHLKLISFLLDGDIMIRLT